VNLLETRKAQGCTNHIVTSLQFLPHDTMLAWYIRQCLSACLSVYLSQVGVLPRRPNLESCKQCCTIA